MLPPGATPMIAFASLKKASFSGASGALPAQKQATKQIPRTHRFTIQFMVISFLLLFSGGPEELDPL